MNSSLAFHAYFAPEGQSFTPGHQVAREVAEVGDQFIRKELTVIGSWYFNAGEYEELIRLVRRGVKTEKIITHRFSLEKAQEAFSTFVSGESGKVIFVSARNR